MFSFVAMEKILAAQKKEANDNILADIPEWDKMLPT